MLKKLFTTLCLALVICIILSACGAGASAASDAADTLYSIGLFQGVGLDNNGEPIFELDRAPTRAEAITMLVRLLGASPDSAPSPALPFTDVPQWASPYVAYAYRNGLTNGTGATTFGSNDAATANQYISFALRALGYSSQIDFNWNEAWKLSDNLGLTQGQFGAGSTISRGDVASISLSALYQPLSSSNETLAYRLCASGAIKDTVRAREILGLSAFNGKSASLAPLELHFIDVGQGDSILAICGEHAMLVDGGNVADSSLIYSYLKSHNITSLDYLVATHAHEDHVGGLAGALSFASVKTALCPVSQYDSTAFSNFKAALAKQNVSINVPRTGDNFLLGDAGVAILGPWAVYNDVNNSSMVLRIDHGEKSFLLMSDAGFESERDILDSGVSVDADLIKIGHHGSESSTGYRLLYEASPKYAVLSCGKDNPYGHPDEALLSRLRDADVKLFRTDMQGHIVCISNGHSLDISTAKNYNIITNPIEKTETPPPTESPVVQPDNYIGNINSYIFHLPSCSSLPMEKNRVYFSFRESAINAGYRACKRCYP